MRIAGLLLLLAACDHPHSALDITSDIGFTRIELFFTDASIDPVTDPTKLPQSTPGVMRASATGELDVRLFDPADIWTSDAPVTAISLGIPQRIGAGAYLAVIASDQTGPIAYAEVEYHDAKIVKYELPLVKLPVSPPAPNVELKLLVPCKPGGTGTICPHDPVMTMHSNPVPGNRPQIATIRVRGVMEPVGFINGSQDPGTGFYRDGDPTVLTANAFTIHTSSPDNTYYLNAGALALPAVRAWDYFASIPVDAGATIDYGVSGGPDEAANPAHIVAGTSVDASGAYNGQYAVVDLVDLADAQVGATRPWPAGAEVWSRPDGRPACLRLTTAAGTHFVTTKGDADCDGFIDAEDDCDPTLYCDPNKGSLGCVARCTEAFSHQGGQVRLSTCINGRDTVDKCPASDMPVSFCVAQTPSCPLGPPVPPHADTLTCVTEMRSDVDCTYTLASAGCPGDMHVPIANITPAQCQGVTILDQSGAGVLLNNNGGSPCDIVLRFEVNPPDVNALANVMLGIPATNGGFDTVVVKLEAKSGTTCPSMPCDTTGVEPHDCR